MRTLSDSRWMRRAMPWPCCGPRMSVRRMSRSSVPCKWAAYSRSDRFRIDIRPQYPDDSGCRSPRKCAADDFDREIQAHLELETARLVDEGMASDAARTEANRRFGNVTRARERFHETGRALWIDRAVHDVRCGLRNLRRYPV